MNDYYEISQGLMEKLAVEAFQVAMVCISFSFQDFDSNRALVVQNNC